MSLRQLLSQGRLKRHKTTKKEINDLLRLVRRDLKDARVGGLSSDRKFATAYNAVLQASVILLCCRGYKPRGIGHHFTVFQAMKKIMGKEYYDLADYFDSCRAKRNITDYSYAGMISEKETCELIAEAEKFMKIVKGWIRRNYPELL